MSIELKLTPIRCIFQKPSDDFYIYACETGSEEVETNKYDNITIKGKMQRLDLDVEYTAQIIEAERHPQYGVSYNVISIFQDVPDSIDDQKNYLLAILTENQVNEIYKVYPNEDIIGLFKDEKFDWKKVRGFGEYTYNIVRNKIMENLEFKLLFSELGKYGITYDTIRKIIAEFGSAQLAIQMVKSNAYVLTRIHGIGFKKADAIALNMSRYNIKELLISGKINDQEADEMKQKAFESPNRISAGIRHAILEEQSKGHTYVTRNNLIKICVELLQLNGVLIDEQIEYTDGLYISDDKDKIALQSTYDAEEYISKKIMDMVSSSKELDFDVEKFIRKMEDKYKDILKHGLSEQQKQFFYNVKNNSVNLLVGYAGCGKSLLQKLLGDLLSDIGMTAVWLAPTGK